ncbi:MAG TPA: dihydrolipoyl dehydrogenase [Quisquiliibacterium sp.]|nr:dihydrolipoyl dehydrogenase [Quisquiliibacterium sp.]
MTQAEVDLAIIGGGPAGYVAAIRAAQLGMRVALVERAELGGTCLNWGCIPTKALLHTADLLRACLDAARFGVRVGEASVDLGKAVEHSRQVAARLNSGVRHLLRRHRVAVHEGSARILEAGRVEVTEAAGGRSLLAARDVLVATGARARRWPGLEAADPDRVWSYREALTPKGVPASLLVIGAGAIGMEFASFYAALGTRVTVVEAQERVLPAEDDEVSAFVQASFEGEGIRVLTGCTVEAIGLGPDGVRAELRRADQRERVEAERVLVAIGVAGNVEGLGLESTAVRVERGFIVADALGATAQPGVHAVGDVAGPPWLAHKASHQALACVERIAGVAARDGGGSHAKIPACTFCHPQVASVGLSERAARALGRKVKVGRFPFSGNGRAIAAGLGDGLVKTVFDGDTGELLGAHLVGSGVTELVQGFTIATALEATEAELIDVVFPHPTLSEAMHESVLAAFGRALHV